MRYDWRGKDFNFNKFSLFQKVKFCMCSSVLYKGLSRVSLYNCTKIIYCTCAMYDHIHLTSIHKIKKEFQAGKFSLKDNI